MPMATRRAASVQPTPVIPSTSSSSSIHLAAPLTRRQTRSSTVEPTRSQSPGLPPLTTSTTPESVASSDIATRSNSESPSRDGTDDSKSTVVGDDMFGRDGSGLRGRNVEDMSELEEKGLLRRRSPEREGESGSSSPRRRVPVSTGRGEKGGQVSYERIVLDEKEEEGSGLSSTRDKQAFALLILLCKSAHP
jgi:PAT family acetyl-CoA transporter-like MFS transporter 1